MKLLCGSCSLSESINKYKTMLNDAINQETDSLVSERIIALSEAVDARVFKCVFCNTRLNNFMRIDLNNVIGKYLEFYYFGECHLFLSLYQYIQMGINQNELIYISLDKQTCDKLIRYLLIKGTPIQNIAFKSLNELMITGRHNRVERIKKKIDAVCLEDEVKQYSGIRWIGKQPTYTIEGVSQKKFLRWKTDLRQAITNSVISIMCIYDGDKYIYKENYTSENTKERNLKGALCIADNLALKESR